MEDCVRNWDMSCFCLLKCCIKINNIAYCVVFVSFKHPNYYKMFLSVMKESIVNCVSVSPN